MTLDPLDAMTERLRAFTRSASLDQLASLGELIVMATGIPDAAASAAEWTCEAYRQPDGGGLPAEVGALCFFAAPHVRRCATPDVCHAEMTAERQRVFDAIRASPNPMWQGIDITSPDQLLNGPDA